ncbi:hypothetical protein C8R44DRAFT_887448 [Mycena epipterygia]|nr:hypothetical protein C8R44DRAFT_887448 [Mycena epipterygia]
MHDFAGLGGDAAFLESETRTQVARGVSISLGLAQASARAHTLPEPLPAPNGLGPRNEADAVCRDVYYAVVLSVVAPA